MNNINEEYYYTVYSNDEIIVKNMKFFEMAKFIINNNVFFDRITYTFSKTFQDKDFFVGNRNEFIGTILNDNVLDKCFYTKPECLLFDQDRLVYIGTCKEIMEFLDTYKSNDLTMTNLRNVIIHRGSDKFIKSELNDSSLLMYKADLLEQSCCNYKKNKNSIAKYKRSKKIFIFLLIFNILFLLYFFINPLTLLSAFYMTIVSLLDIFVIPNNIESLLLYKEKRKLEKGDIAAIGNLEKEIDNELSTDKSKEKLQQKTYSKYTYHYDGKQLNIEEEKVCLNRTLKK